MFAINRLGIAVNTVQIAGPGDIPNHDRIFVLGKLEQMRRQVTRTSPISQGIRWLHRTAIKFRYTYHRKSA
jgi:hypothetical protein